MSSAKNYTVADLKKMAKDAKIPGYSTKIKAELEALLGLPVTGKPRSPKVAAPVASPTTAVASPTPATSGATSSPVPAKPVVVVPQVEYVQIKEIYDDQEIISLLLRSDVDDVEKLKTQAQLPIEERERDDDADFDYVELLIKKRKRFVATQFIEYEPSENVRFSIVVYMY